MDQITIEAEQRTALRKKVGALRRAGITPFHLYGPSMPSESLQADTTVLVHALNDAGYTTPLTVKVGSEEHFVMVDRIQRHPITDHLLHVDMVAISHTQRVHALVPLHFEGEALAAREDGAQVAEDHHEVELEALAMEMPHGLTVDLSVLTRADSAIHAKDLALPASVTLVTDPDTVLVRIALRRGSEVSDTGEEAAIAAPVAEAAPTAEDAPAEQAEAAAEGETSEETASE